MNKLSCSFLPCLSKLFTEQYARMSPRAALNNSALVSAGLAEAETANTGKLPRYTLVPAAAGTGAGWLDLKLDFAGALSNSVNHGKAKLHSQTAGTLLLRAQLVDFTGWLKRNFRRQDTILLKMDIEGAEHAIIPSLLDNGILDLVDVLAWECHPPPKIGKQACVTLTQRIAARNLTMIGGERMAIRL